MKRYFLALTLSVFALMSAAVPSRADGETPTPVPAIPLFSNPRPTLGYLLSQLTHDTEYLNSLDTETLLDIGVATQFSEIRVDVRSNLEIDDLDWIHQTVLSILAHRANFISATPARTPL